MELLIEVVKLATALVALATAMLALAQALLRQGHSKVEDDAHAEKSEGR